MCVCMAIIKIEQSYAEKHTDCKIFECVLIRFKQ